MIKQCDPLRRKGKIQTVFLLGQTLCVRTLRQINLFKFKVQKCPRTVLHIMYTRPTIIIYGNGNVRVARKLDVSINRIVYDNANN